MSAPKIKVQVVALVELKELGCQVMAFVTIGANARLIRDRSAAVASATVRKISAWHSISEA